MNRKIAVVLLITEVCFAGKSFTQPIPSSCLPPWALQQAYDHDVKNIAVKYMRDIQSPDTIYVTIPQSQQTPVMEGLAAVFNCAHPGRDSIFDMYCVHDLAYQPVTPGFIISINASAPWIQAWQNLQTLTGLPVLDSLLVKYDLHITSWFSFINAGVFSSSKLLNPFALEDSLQWASADILYLDPDMLIGAAGNIVYEKEGEIRKYTFYFQWSDCFDGCDNWHYWQYAVNTDCSVEYLGTGDWGFFGVEPLPAPINCNITTDFNSTEPAELEYTMYPNPSQNLLNIRFPARISGKVVCEFYTSAGDLCKSFVKEATAEFSVNIADLPEDVYLVRITDGKRVVTARFVK